MTEGADLSVNCTHTDAMSIFWQRGGVRIQSDDTNFMIEPLSGSTSTLTLSPSADHTVHTGEYECVAVTSTGAEMSLSFDITILCKYIHSESRCVFPNKHTMYCVWHQSQASHGE